MNGEIQKMKNRPINKLCNIDSLTRTDIEKNELIKAVVKKIFLSAFILFFIMSAFLTIYLVKVLNNAPDVELLELYYPDQTTQIFDKYNNLVASVHGDEDRVSVMLKDISRDLQLAVIAIEDKRFYQHNGIDLMGTIRAFRSNISNDDSLQGGSTITQQLVKNSFLTSQRSLKRKFLEAVLAVKVEKYFSKDEILEKYLNIIYWGNRSYGIEQAARKYFNKPAKNLNLAEASLLAGLIKAPELYSPYSNLQLAKQRQKIVLEKMLEAGYITKKQKDLAYAGPIRLKPRKFEYPKYIYFVDYVTYLLRKEYGDNIVRRGGFKVYTTLDPKVQEIAEKTMTAGVKALAGTGVREGALVCIDVNTADILAVVGGMDYEKSQYNRAVLAKRPVGSGFKPVVYLTGLRLGVITPDSIIYDAPVSYRTKWNVWSPHNWDGRYMGKMTIRQALTLSRNTPTVRIALKVGINKIIETARLLGIKSLIRPGFSMVLGSSEITPLEVATSYSTLARDGIFIEPSAIRYVKDSKGNTIEIPDRNPVRVFDSKFIRELTSILMDVVEKGTGRSARIEGRQVAGKTGTTDSVKDVWFSGYTPDTVTTIWMGNDQNTSLHGVFSSNCAILWKNFMTSYYQAKNIAPQTFPMTEQEISKYAPKKIKIENEKDKNTDKKDTDTSAAGTSSGAAASNQYNRSGQSAKKTSTGEIKPPPRTYIPDEKDFEKRYERAQQNNRSTQRNYNYRNNYNYGRNYYGR